MVLESVLIKFLNMWLSSFPITTYEEVVFSLLYMLASFVIEVNWLLGSLFCSIDLSLLLCQYHTILITVSL